MLWLSHINTGKHQKQRPVFLELVTISVQTAGVMMTPYSSTPDGVELQIGTNYLGHVLLTHLLFDKLNTSGTRTHFSRIINVSSHVHYAGELGNLKDTLHGYDRQLSQSIFVKETQFWDTMSLIGFAFFRRSYSAHASYAQSKLALIMWTYLLDRTFQRLGNCITCNAVHPGIVNTPLYRHIHWSIALFLRPIAQHLFLVGWSKLLHISPGSPLATFHQQNSKFTHVFSFDNTLSEQTPEEAADGILFAALSDSLEGRGCLYLDNCQAIDSSATSYSTAAQWRLWRWTNDFIKMPHLEGEQLEDEQAMNWRDDWRICREPHAQPGCRLCSREHLTNITMPFVFSCNKTSANCFTSCSRSARYNAQKSGVHLHFSSQSPGWRIARGNISFHVSLKTK